MTTAAKVYAGLLGVFAVFAWYTDVTLLHSPREHLLPDVLLSIASLPASLSLSPLCEHWPNFCSLPLAQLGWLTFCAAAQALLVFLLAKHLSKSRRRKEQTL
jgi:hypothetical protein